MTPELVPRTKTEPGEAHLTGEQFGELLARFTEAVEREPTPAEAHLQTCEACSAELASLREAITLFREASDAYAEKELRGIPRWKLPRRAEFRKAFVPAYWMAAAAMFLTALFPLQVLRRHAVGTPLTVAATATVSNTASSSQSDEALLEDVNREVSRTVPASMQALDDPSDNSAVADSQSSDVTTNERKD